MAFGFGDFLNHGVPYVQWKNKSQPKWRSRSHKRSASESRVWRNHWFIDLYGFYILQRRMGLVFVRTVRQSVVLNCYLAAYRIGHWSSSAFKIFYGFINERAGRKTQLRRWTCEIWGRKWKLVGSKFIIGLKLGKNEFFEWQEIVILSIHLKIKTKITHCWAINDQKDVSRKNEKKKQNEH